MVQVSVVYTGGSKIAEHGGANPADGSVPIVVNAPGGSVKPGVYDSSVERTQIAPTVLDLLGLHRTPYGRSGGKARGARPGIARH